MRFLALAICAVLTAMPAHAVLTVEFVEIQRGVFREPGCKYEGKIGSRRLDDACLHECKISYPVVGGLGSLARQKQINAQWYEEAEDRLCKGDKVAVGLPQERTPNLFHHTYQLLLNDGKILSFLKENYNYSFGAAHSLHGSQGVIVDVPAARILQHGDILDAKQYAALNGYLRQKLAESQETSEQVREDMKAVYLSAKKQKITLVLDAKKGLLARFGIYQVAPYSAGEIDIPIPARFIRHPHIRSLVEAIEKHHA